jgi:hypothetical protein
MEGLTKQAPIPLVELLIEIWKEKQGDTAKAIEHYEKFLDLWNAFRSSRRKNADPGIAEVRIT